MLFQFTMAFSLVSGSVKEDQQLFHDLLDKWAINMAHCSSLCVKADITSTGAESYTLQYLTNIKGNDWDAEVISSRFGHGRYLGLDKKLYFINQDPQKGKSFAKLEARQAYDYLHRHLWHYWFASCSNGKNSVVTLSEYFKSAKLISHSDNQIDGRPCVHFTVQDKLGLTVDLYFSKADDYALCRLDYPGEMKSSQVVKSWTKVNGNVRIPSDVFWVREMDGKKVEIQAKFTQIEINPQYPSSFLKLRFPDNCSLFSDIDNSCNKVDNNGNIIGPCTNDQGKPIIYAGRTAIVDVPEKKPVAWQLYVYPSLGLLAVLTAYLMWRRRRASP